MSFKISTKLGILAAVAMVFCVLFAGAASAQSDPYGGGKPDVKGTLIGNSQTGEGEEPPSVAGTTTLPGEEPATAPAVQPGTLPFTGGEVTTFLILGIGAVALGTLVVRKTRTDS